MREAALGDLTREVVDALSYKKRRDAPPFAIDIGNRFSLFPIT